MPSVKPKVAHCEEYDSDVSAVKPGTRVKAQRRATTTGPPVSMDRHRGKHRSSNSDSGYSSHTTGTQESKASADSRAMPPPDRPASAQTTAKNKPVLVQRTSSQRNGQPPPSRSPTKPMPTRTCSDPTCGDPSCLAAAQIANRRNSAMQYPVQVPSPYASSPAGQHAVPYQYTYQQPPQSHLAQPVPTLAQPQPRVSSSSQQARPASFHAAYSYTTPMSSGPPPSGSAYQSLPYHAALQQQAAMSGGLYGSTPPNQFTPNYAQASPIRSSPIATSAAPGQGLQRTISARSMDRPMISGPSARSQPQSIQSARAIPSRQQPTRPSRMPGTFESSESGSETESESEYSDEEYRQQRARQRTSRILSSSSQRRPSLNQRTVTDSAAYTRPSRDVLVRNPRSDHILEDIMSSDNLDSDQTTRAVAGRARTAYTGSSKSSRRPSVSTNASSGRTRTTAPSSMASSQIIVEDSKGRRVSYLSQRDREQIARQLQALELDKQRRQMEREAEAYQSQVRGSKQPELTADNIRKQSSRASGSHAGHSRSSSHAGGDGFKIDYGGTTLHVYGDTTVELQPGEDGAPAKMIIGSGSGKDGTYHGGSKSSSSRVGRSRGASERGSRRRERSIREDGYEPAL